MRNERFRNIRIRWEVCGFMEGILGTRNRYMEFFCQTSYLSSQRRYNGTIARWGRACIIFKSNTLQRDSLPLPGQLFVPQDVGCSNTGDFGLGCRGHSHSYATISSTPLPLIIRSTLIPQDNPFAPLLFRHYTSFVPRISPHVAWISRLAQLLHMSGLERNGWLLIV